MTEPNGTTPGGDGAGGARRGRAPGQPGRGSGGRRGTAPRRSELRRSGDYSGPSARSGPVPGLVAGLATCASYPASDERHTARYRAHGGRPPRAASTRPSATRSPAAPRRSRSSPARARARPACSPAASRGRRARARRPAPRPRGHVHPQGRGRAAHPPRPPRRAARRSPPAPSTPSRSPSCGAAPTTQGRPMPDAARTQGADPRPARRRPRARGRARRRRARVRDRVGQGPPGQARRLRAGGRPSPAAPRRARRPRSPTSTAATSARSASAASSTSTTSSRAAPTCSRRDAEFAAAQRWRFRHLFVDEFQDASPAQFRLLRAWLGDRADLCVVGDPDQAIYGFAGADPPYLARLRGALPARAVPRRSASSASAATTGRRPRSSPRPSAVLGPPGRRRPPVHAAEPDGPVPTVTEYDDRRGRSARRRPRAARRRRARPAVVAHGGALPRQRAVGAVRGGARRAGRPVPRARRRRASSTAPR